MFLLSDSPALMADIFLKPQCDQFEIRLIKFRLPLSDLASTLNVEIVRPKSSRITKNLSPIFLRREMKKKTVTPARINLRASVFKLFWLELFWFTSLKSGRFS